MHQKTGNWAGKTVACARGSFRFREKSIPVLDLPGTYSLQARSAEEIIARDRIAAGTRDLLVVVCDASCLERGLRFLKQIRDLGPRKPGRTALCVNLCDEAERNGIRIDFPFLAQALNLPVIPCTARDRRSVKQLKEKLAQLFLSPGCPHPAECPFSAGCQNPEHQKNPELLPDFSPEETAKRAVTFTRPDFRRRQEAIDRLVTGPVWGAVLMLALLLAVFWLTIAGASVPSAWLSRFFTALEPRLFSLLTGACLPEAVTDCAVRGVYRVTAWVIAVMLPPMAIFFPLFTLLEDLGYLPRAAYNMDCAFRRCHSCGKQCLTMAMGFGCNAAGVMGCRIIDSPRERLIAILTNSLVPCNGRFPTLILLISLASLTAGGSAPGSFLAAAALTGLILLGILATLFSSLLLSRTVLRGVPSSFTLELPPWRRPQAGKIILRSLADRTLFVLTRAAAAAAPAGLLIWLLGNCAPDGLPLLSRLAAFLDPAGRFLGMDGMILTGFLLGFPAGEIVLPIIVMGYLQDGALAEIAGAAPLAELFLAHGWSVQTVLCTAVFCLFHWPCFATCLTIRRETGSLLWTLASVLLPLGIGCALCLLIRLIL